MAWAVLGSGRAWGADLAPTKPPAAVLTNPAALPLSAPPAADTNLPPGRVVRLSDGQLFVPAGWSTNTALTGLTLHLHGALGTTARNFVAAKAPGVLVVVVEPGLSEAYAKPFRDPSRFWRILAEAATALELPGTDGTAFGAVTVSSFSAGYGGVREMLKDPAIFARIGALVMADSIYAGFDGPAGERRVSEQNLSGFLRFAREAVAGRKRFVLSHSALATPAYASTVETADYLLTMLGLEREFLAESWAPGLELLSRCRQGGLEVYGFAGTTGSDHMQHLLNLRLFLSRRFWTSASGGGGPD